MDYGPFGWIEEYSPLFAKWTGSGQHFGFLNQPNAGFANYNVLVESVVHVIAAARQEETNQVVNRDELSKPILEEGAEIFQNAIAETFRVKLGFAREQEAGDDIWDQLEPLMRKSRVDWTIFFRQLTEVARDIEKYSDLDKDMIAILEGDEEHRPGSSAFYEPLSEDGRQEWTKWSHKWRETLLANGRAQTAFEGMRASNPKFILREWMLVDAYTDAGNGLEAELFNLNSLIQRPYDEGSEANVRKYYRRAPDAQLTKGGTGFMS